MSSFFRLIAAGPMFFVSAWLLMLFAGATQADTGIRPFGYLTSMLVTIGLWLTLAPAIAAVAGRGKGRSAPAKKPKRPQPYTDTYEQRYEERRYDEN